MAGQFRQRRFGGRSGGGLGEDVNPSAYIVNLADCMLVLACGVIVALVAYFDVDLTGVQKLKDEQMKPVDPWAMPEDIGEGGSYYIEAGIVYMDPNTGQLYIVEDATPNAAPGTNPDTDRDTGSDAAPASPNNNEIQNSRANGAD